MRVLGDASMGWSGGNIAESVDGVGYQDSLLKFSSKGLDLGLELEIIDKE